MRVCILFRDIGHYHAARLAQAAQAINGDLIVIASSAVTSFAEFAPPTSAARRYEVVALYPDLAARRAATADGAAARRVAQTLERLMPDVVAVAGWAEAESFAAIAWARRRGKGIILMSESQESDASRSRLREAVKGWVVRHCDAALVGGRSHRDYVVRLGMAPERVALGYDAVDNAYFAAATAAVRQDAGRLRQLHGLPPRYMLAVARLVEKKNIPTLLSAYAAYAASGAEPCRLVVLGEGPDCAALADRVEQLEIGHLVSFPGFAAYETLPVYYGLATLFVHVSLVEQWGLVVNEAMASGLPVLVSRHCGCAAELVREGINGHLLDPSDVPALTELMSRMAGLSDGQLAAMGRQSRTIVADWGTERFARGFRAALNIAAREKPRRFSPLDRLALGALARMRFEQVL